MTDLVQVRYVSSRIHGWNRGDIRTCARYIAESLCDVPNPVAVWHKDRQMSDYAKSVVDEEEIQKKHKDQKIRHAKMRARKHRR